MTRWQLETRVSLVTGLNPNLTTRADDSHAAPVLGSGLDTVGPTFPRATPQRFRTCQAQDKVLRVDSN